MFGCLHTHGQNIDYVNIKSGIYDNKSLAFVYFVVEKFSLSSPFRKKLSYPLSNNKDIIDDVLIHEKVA